MTEAPAPDISRRVEALIARRRVPGATYRLQFNSQFTFRDALAIVPYLDALGISDVYSSPLFRARPGSTHGYDVSDYARLNPDLGSEAELAALAEALRAHGMGLLMDMVPNHMGIGNSNPWWMDLLENGVASPYAAYFDIDWYPIKPEMAGKVLLPILGDQYGVVLENGELRLDYTDGAFRLRYYETWLPVAPHSYAEVLAAAEPELRAALGDEHEQVQEFQSILTAIRYLPPHTEADPAHLAERTREKAVIRRRLARLHAESATVQAALEAALRLFNGVPGDARSFDRLDALIAAQSYRLAYWRVATEEINYRRFFDINDLAAVRVELPQVFEDSHALVLRLLAAGQVTGLRIDHPDGLHNPAAYFRQLQQRYALEVLRAEGSTGDEPTRLLIDLFSIFENTPPPRPLYVVAEKILSAEEPLPSDWAVDGTTGYDFLNAANGLFVDAGNAPRLDTIYRRFVAPDDPQALLSFPQLVARTKQLIMEQALASELTALSHQIERINEKNRRYRDFTLSGISAAINAVLADLTIYRTYITAPGQASERDRRYLRAAVRQARRQARRVPSAIFTFLEQTLLLDNLHEFRPEDREDVVAAVIKFQQISGPVMAKSVEDTAFYRYHRLVSLNEVGGHPEHVGVSVAEFHQQNAERLRDWPHAMLAATTHDTKRSEDTRARINVLSELPDEWEAAVARWSRLNERHKREVEGERLPDQNAEYLLYQAMLGALEGPERQAGGPQGAGPALLAGGTFAARISAYMEKATKEAKAHTSWLNPNEEYDAALAHFVASILDPAQSKVFLDDFLAFQQRVARFAITNSLAQTLLKLTSPGVPDTYQGAELWDYSLVDPDNRRPVEYGKRAGILSALQAVAEDERAALARDLLARAEDGRVKLYLITQTLQFRRAQPALFAQGAYLPLEARGERRTHLCAFARSHQHQHLLVVVPRLVAALTKRAPRPPLGPDVWGNTQLVLPPTLAARRYRDLLSGLSFNPAQEHHTLRLADVFSTLPVALLAGE